MVKEKNKKLIILNEKKILVSKTNETKFYEDNKMGIWISYLKMVKME